LKQKCKSRRPKAKAKNERVERELEGKFPLFYSFFFCCFLVCFVLSMFEKKKTTTMCHCLLLWWCCREEDDDASVSLSSFVDALPSP